MPADKETGRRARMFALVDRDKRVFSIRHTAGGARAEMRDYVPADLYDDPSAVRRYARKQGWRIVPVIVTIEEKANAR